MIIPIKCFSCGMVIADKYRYYLLEVRKRKLTKSSFTNIDKVQYFTQEFRDKTPEGEVLDELNITRMCCRRHFLTHVDID
jgi:DNA-directed RNA polymerase I, II, and III subunit RPABC5